ncbi:hypothetical protein [Telmatospirillum sp.]|uniref:YybH family protein n=1 Tax=Telmatospirillum sp. TaxID=2079197 RepID=UPI002849A6E3|nr:hypothetical protein [Telmatospirillum sp.]MDR3437576.1 hypothetical protein [Telmatospirillum sp.]
MRWKIVGVLLLAAGLTGCAANSSLPTDRMAAAEALAADRAFAAMAARDGPGAAFQAFSAADAVSFIRADAHMRPQDWPPLFPSTARLTWTPAEAHASDDGSLAWTWGRYDWTRIASGKQETHTTGRYLTVWQRQPDGSWRFRADTGSPD